MITVTFNGEAVYLLPYRPNWVTLPAWRASISADTNQSLQGNETRRAYAATLISEIDFSDLLTSSQAADFRVGLQRVKNSRILCPFWPSKQLASASALPPLATGAWLIAEPDLSIYEVNTTGTAGTFTPSASAFRVPLMLGAFIKDPIPTAETSTIQTWKLSFRESGPTTYALTPTGTDGSAGTALPTGQTPKVFPFFPNWAKKPEAGAAHVNIIRTSVGFGRDPLEVYFPQVSSRDLNLTFTKTTCADVARIAYFFLKRQGIVESFWLPGALDECQLVTATTGSSATVYVDRVAGIGDNVWLAFRNMNTGAVEIRKVVSSDTGANTLTLDAAPAVYTPGKVRIVSAILARFKQPQLAVSFITDAVAEATISFTEAQQEYTTQAGETSGTTIGGLTLTAYLFRFSQVYAGTTIYNRYTSFEKTITIAGTETYTKNTGIIFDHGDITDSLQPDKTSVSITSRVFPGNPLLLFMPNQLEGPLYLEILSCTPDSFGAASTATLLFYGKVSKPQFNGPVIKADVLNILSALSRNVPRYNLQPTCGYKLYGPSCGVDRAAFRESVTVAGLSGNLLTINLTTTHPAAYFAWGRIYTGSGSGYQSRSVYGSGATGAGVCVLTLDRAFSSAVAIGSAMTVEPGCDKSTTACGSAKFNNFVRFGGMPFVPPGNPSLVKITQNQTSGGKK